MATTNRRMITDPQRRALTILRDHPRITCGEFADRMWPESDGHNRVHKCGAYGASRGAKMPFVAGGYLGKLEAMGYVERFYRDSYPCAPPRFRLTDDGRKSIANDSPVDSGKDV